MELIAKSAPARLAICQSCEHLKTTAGVQRCGKCGCFIAAKTKFSRAKCPIGKW